jgi:hypothetical protein
MFPNYCVGDRAILEEEDALQLEKDGCVRLLEEVPLSPPPRLDSANANKGNKITRALKKFRHWLSKLIVTWLKKYAEEVV